MAFFLKWIVLPCCGLLLLLVVAVFLAVSGQRSGWERELQAWENSGRPVNFHAERDRAVADADNRAVGWLGVAALLEEVEAAEAEASPDDDAAGLAIQFPAYADPEDLAAALESRAEALSLATQAAARADARWPIDWDNPMADGAAWDATEAARAVGRLLVAAATHEALAGRHAEADRHLAHAVLLADDAGRMPALTPELVRVALLAEVLDALEEREDPERFPRTLAALRASGVREQVADAVAEEAAVGLAMLEGDEDMKALGELPYLVPMQKRGLLRAQGEAADRLEESWPAALDYPQEDPGLGNFFAAIVAPAVGSAVQTTALFDTRRRLFLLAHAGGPAAELDADPFGGDQPFQRAEAPDGGRVLWSAGVNRPELDDQEREHLILQVGTDWLPDGLASLPAVPESPDF